VEPQGQAWPNIRLAQTLAGRLGLTDPVFSMSQPDILRALFHGAKGAAAAFDPDTLIEGSPVSIAGRTGQEFRTPSGKLEFYSESLAAQGAPPMPDWHADPDEARQMPRYPLRLLTAPGYFQSHTAFSGVAFLRKREGAPFAVLHPDDAKARGLTRGQMVRLFNDRAAIGLTLQVRDEVPPGVVLVPGQRPDDETGSGTVNMLCADSFTDMGAGATYQSTWLEVSAW
jgi:anaerobic selenocysteine-containing dehydrogenase